MSTTYDTRPVSVRAALPVALRESLPPRVRALLRDAPLADTRGLTAVGAAAVAVGSGLLGAVVDAVTGPRFGTTFGIFFVLGCALAAYKAHREDIFAAFVIPPLAYVVVTLVLGMLGAGRPPAAATLSRPSYVLINALVFDAPALLWASAAAGAVTSLRWAGTPVRFPRAAPRDSD
ncbi:MAG: DUF6542 domain-containing protein [Mycobacteriales bacterium]|nr:hypothetical protein [Frankia sp.]